jgi:hypothetical protein
MTGLFPSATDGQSVSVISPQSRFCTPLPQPRYYHILEDQCVSASRCRGQTVQANQKNNSTGQSFRSHNWYAGLSLNQILGRIPPCPDCFFRRLFADSAPYQWYGCSVPFYSSDNLHDYVSCKMISPMALSSSIYAARLPFRPQPIYSEHNYRNRLFKR